MDEESIEREVGVGPYPLPWPEDPRFDPELLRNGDRRNVLDAYRYWTNEAIVALAVKQGRALESQSHVDSGRLLAVAQCAADSAMATAKIFRPTSVWTWRPVPNDELTVASGCAGYLHGRPEGCVIIVFRDSRPDDAPLAALNVDVGVGEVASAGDARHLRFRALDLGGALYTRAITYVYGRVDLSDVKVR
jgi:hypothetical protein